MLPMAETSAPNERPIDRPDPNPDAPMHNTFRSLLGGPQWSYYCMPY